MKQMKVIQSPKLESDSETVNSQLDALKQKNKQVKGAKLPIHTTIVRAPGDSTATSTAVTAITIHRRRMSSTPMC